MFNTVLTCSHQSSTKHHTQHLGLQYRDVHLRNVLMHVTLGALSCAQRLKNTYYMYM